MGGDVSVESDGESYTRFTVKLPQAAAPVDKTQKEKGHREKQGKEKQNKEKAPKEKQNKENTLSFRMPWNRQKSENGQGESEKEA